MTIAVTLSGCTTPISRPIVAAVQLCAAVALAEPEMLADELFLLLERALVAAWSMGWKGLDDRLVRMGEAMIRAPTIFWGGTPIGPIP